MYIGTTFRKQVFECLHTTRPRVHFQVQHRLLCTFLPRVNPATQVYTAIQEESVHPKQLVPPDAQPNQEEEGKKTATGQSSGVGGGCGFCLYSDPVLQALRAVCTPFHPLQFPCLLHTSCTRLLTIPHIPMPYSSHQLGCAYVAYLHGMPFYFHHPTTRTQLRARHTSGLETLI